MTARSPYRYQAYETMNRILRHVERLLAARNRDFPYDACDHEGFIRMAYVVLLQRAIDPSGLASWRRRIATGHFDRTYVVKEILKSEEYRKRFGVDIIDKLHRSRQEWIRTIPKFRRVLDIGGSSANCPEGALIELGYPHRPEILHVLDLPPDKQYWGVPRYSQTEPIAFPWGTVRYFHGSAEQIHDVAELQQNRYDGVFLGQAIEHIYPEALPRMLEWIAQHLEPDGVLVFDTPNRLLTVIQCPGQLTDPDHKYEYNPGELVQRLEDAGFRVTRKTGMVHLPVQAASGEYNQLEFEHAAMLSDDADTCFLFALEAKVDRDAAARHA